MLKYYHGSDVDSINDIYNNGADVTKGGGELGQGFYVGSSMWRASSWAWHQAKKRNKNYGVIEYDINEKGILNLDLLCKNRRSTLQYYRNLKKKKNFKVKLNHDVVWAPIVGMNIKDVYQMKFESEKGQDFINNQNKTIL